MVKRRKWEIGEESEEEEEEPRERERGRGREDAIQAAVYLQHTPKGILRATNTRDQFVSQL